MIVSADEIGSNMHQHEKLKEDLFVLADSIHVDKKLVIDSIKIHLVSPTRVKLKCKPEQSWKNNKSSKRNIYKSSYNKKYSKRN
jgi:hypothetical protein